MMQNSNRARKHMFIWLQHGISPPVYLQIDY